MVGSSSNILFQNNHPRMTEEYPETHPEQRVITEHGSKYNSQSGSHNNSRNIQNPDG